MSDDQTPIKGKGEEMIPDRGLPFTEIETQEEITTENSFIKNEPSLEGTSYVSEAETTVQVEDSEAWFTAAEELEADMEKIFKDPSLAPEETQGETSSEMESEKLAPNADFDLVNTISENILDIEEIRTREVERSEDVHVAAPDFEGEEDMDFVAARVAVDLSREDQESIRLESGALLMDEEINMDEGPDKFGDVSEEAAPPAEEFISESTFSSEMKEVKGAIISVTDEEKMMPSAPVITSIKSSAEVTRETKVIRSTALELPGPISGIVEESAPETIAGLFAAKKMLDLLIPNKRVEQLWSRADQLQTQVFCEINDLNLARALLEQIRSAKNLILADKENFEEAERSINEVEYRIIYGKRFKKWGLLGYILLAYEVICGAAAVYIMFLLFQAGTDGLNLNIEGLLTKSEIFIGIFAALFGALGGVAGALFALWRYITEQKFNPQFSIWYVTQPIIGLTIGSMIYIILKIGLSITAGSVNVEVGSLFLPCLLAYLAGFQQNVFLDLARQILKQLKIDKDKPEDKNLADSTNPAE